MLSADPPFHPIWAYSAVLLSWFIAQATKVIRDYLRNKRLNIKSFLDTGGMPSSHSASVASLTTAVGLYYGFASVPFLMTIVFTLITLFDAAGVRRSVGRQAQLLNQMIDDMGRHQEITYDRVKELLGHTPIQVFTGVFLGVAIALILCR
jgi:acid phosphatase family membrane protein YuiD